ncbi:AAA family ATPase [Olivibacter sp. 47]|uniref:AAA family ATPase n=1 Tax=Olivibacter sp. 47 TaxID=3056486 RepID=UPI0025A3EFB4|nr:AAA family ATPase [Olivibacter sp. 47]MDM8173174.1 AAA family ATPase [Olivibacter sp. 47]
MRRRRWLSRKTTNNEKLIYKNIENMAKTTKAPAEDFSYIEEMPKPRLKKLIVKNFRCIGATPVEIDLNDIVVLVGANNAGKSSILKAYEVVMSDGSKKGELTIEDFPNNIVNPEKPPQIELHTIVYDERVGQQWLEKVDGGYLVKERWTWFDTGKPVRRGWNMESGSWDDKSYPLGLQM